MQSDHRIDIPGTTYYYLHLSPFLAAIEGIDDTSRRQYLALYREAVDEHLRAADEAIAQMRRLERHLGELIDVTDINADTGGYRSTWRDREETLITFSRYGKEFRSFLNEARAALESLTFEVVTALHGVVEGDTRIGFTAKLERVVKSYPAVQPFAAFVASVDDPTYAQLDRMRQISFHRRIIETANTLRFDLSGDATDSPPSINIRLPDDIAAIPPTFERDQYVVVFAIEAIFAVRQIVDDGYRVATMALASGMDSASVVR